jgi:O-succinylbenzoate synthase
MMYEQPLAGGALEDMAELQRRVRTPICADESADSLAAFEEILRLGSARILNIKIQRVGGLTPAVAMYQRAVAAGVSCWLGTMPELGVASAQG